MVALCLLVLMTWQNKDVRTQCELPNPNFNFVVISLTLEVKKKKINFLPHFLKSPLTRHDSSPKYKAGNKRRWESTVPLISQEIELTAGIEMDNKYFTVLTTWGSK